VDLRTGDVLIGTRASVDFRGFCGRGGRQCCLARPNRARYQFARQSTRRKFCVRATQTVASASESGRNCMEFDLQLSKLSWTWLACGMFVWNGMQSRFRASERRMVMRLFRLPEELRASGDIFWGVLPQGLLVMWGFLIAQWLSLKCCYEIRSQSGLVGQKVCRLSWRRTFGEVKSYWILLTAARALLTEVLTKNGRLRPELESCFAIRKDCFTRPSLPQPAMDQPMRPSSHKTQHPQ